MILDTILFNRDEIRQLPPSKAKDQLMEVIDLSPEEIIHDVINYWGFKNHGLLMSKKLNQNYLKILKKITPKTTDREEFNKEMSTYLKKLI